MWHGGDGRAGVMALRHECSEGDGLGPYGWVEHDGRSYGKQELPDQRTGIRLVTSMVKPAQLLRDPSADVDDAGSDGESVMVYVTSVKVPFYRAPAGIVPVSAVGV